MLNNKGEWQIQVLSWGKESLLGAEGLQEEAGLKQLERT